MNIEELLYTLNSQGEQPKIEAKTAQKVGKSILETICAFANEPYLGGGVLLLGVHKGESSCNDDYEISGVLQPEKLIEDIVSQCRTMFNQPLQVQTFQQTIQEKVVIAIQIPEAHQASKPIYLKSQGLPYGALRRMGSSDVHCTEDDLLVLYQQREVETFDYSIVEDASWEDIDLEAIEDYRKSRAEIHPNAEELRWTDEELLQSLGCLRRKQGHLIPTVAGILLFGTAKAIRRLFPLMRVDYIRIVGKQWVGDPESRYTSLEARGPMLNVIRRILATIIDDLPKAFSLPEGSPQRLEVPIIPMVVIREALVNAIMHRSYRINQPVQVIRYSNRIEIRNPGHSLISEDYLGEPGSKSRNPKIAEVLHETRFAETKGSGIRIMRENMQKAGLSLPFFESDRSQDLFSVTFLFHHFLSKEDLEWLAHFRNFKLTDEQARALIFTKEVGAINNSAYRSINQVDTLAASISLRNLRDKGLLEAKSQGPGTYYLPTEKLLAPLKEKQSLSVKTHQADVKTHQADVKTHQVDVKTHQADVKTHQADVKTHQADELSEKEKLMFQYYLPEDLQQLLKSLNKKSSAQTVREVIIKFCEWKEMTSYELSVLMKREKKHLVRKYLTPLVEEGALVYKYPQMVGHPDQAYKGRGDKL